MVRFSSGMSYTVCNKNGENIPKDAYDWVMGPNVYSMSQFADGGLMATKPYISGSNYLMKMSDYKKGEWQTV